MKIICGLCDKTFTRRFNLRRHIREMHPEIYDNTLVICAVCENKIFSRKWTSKPCMRLQPSELHENEDTNSAWGEKEGENMDTTHTEREKEVRIRILQTPYL